MPHEFAMQIINDNTLFLGVNFQKAHDHLRVPKEIPYLHINIYRIVAPEVG